MPRLRLLLLGPPQIERDGVPLEFDTRKAVALLAYLAVTGQTHSREALAALLWPEYDQARAYANLRRTLWAVNKAVGEEWVDVGRETVSLRRGTGFWLDVDSFRNHLSECKTHGHEDSDVCPACITPLVEAVKLYRDDFLAGFTLRDSPNFDEWQFFEAEGLRSELAGALKRLVCCHSAQREFEPAITYARRWVALDPLHEPAHRELMKLYAWAGQRAAALRQYRECTRILEEELGVPPEEETAQLYEAIRATQLPPPPVGAVPATQVPVGVGPPAEPRHNLPPQLTPFVGRKEKLADIAGLLQNPDCRLLTLVGLGGVGKTRLAIQAATEQLGAFSHGVYFVPLAPLSSAEFIVPTIADALGFSFFQREGEDARQQLLNYLREKQMLLVLDNLEHLVEGVGLLTDILSVAPGVKMLATSRERLNLRGEWVAEIWGMRFPQDEEFDSLEDYSAMQLFMQRAGQADVSFSLSEDEISDASHICQLVEGIPLGIELAAAWVKMLSCQEIVHEIERNLDFLTSSMRDVPERHRSLRAVFDHSWHILSHDERRVFSGLSVFRGGFGREAAEQVAGANLSFLSALVDKSLLRRDPSGRYGMHEVSRQYAAQRLTELSQEEQTRDRHCSYFIGFLQQREEALKGANQIEALDEIGAEIENVRAAWRWAVAHGKVAEIKRAAESLFMFYQMRSLFQEGEEAFGQAVAALESETCRRVNWGVEREAALGLALAFQGYFGWFLYSRENATALLRKSLEVLRPLGARKELALVNTLAVFGQATEDIAEAERMVQESLTIFKEAGDQWGVAASLLRFWVFEYYVRRYHTESKSHLQESLAISRDISDRWGMGLSLFALGEVAHASGAYNEAKRHFQESLAIRRQIGDRQGVGIGLDFLGYVLRELGEYQEAQRLHQESLDISKEIGDRLGIAGSFDNLGLVAHDIGDYEAAERLFQEGLAIRRELGDQWGIGLSLEHLGDVALALGEYEEATRRYEDSLAIYQDIEWLQGVALAHGGLGEVSSAIGDTQQAKQHFHAALDTAMQAWHISTLLDILMGVAQLVAKMGEHERSAEMSALVAQHHASSRHTQDKAERLLAELSSQLPPEAMAAARERSKHKKLEEVVDEVLESPPASKNSLVFP